mmetsp:Transcript_120660/g.209510  ORF Transcript_120660/g.209510 Transcript_120660/m.209510 type:complete len:261 (-) Transcript_120660:105-887(-)
MAPVHFVGGFIVGTIGLVLQGCGGKGGGPSPTPTPSTCKPMSPTDPCYQKCSPGMNCTSEICESLGKIGCNDTQCELMGKNGTNTSHCMSPMSEPGITKDTKCKPAMLSGVYHDLHDANNKIITVSSSYGVTIKPPAPGSKYYVDGVGKNWTVPTGNVGPVNFDCRVIDIDFNVTNKPAPPPSNVTADWAFTSLMSIGWVQKCGPDSVGSDKCGKAGSYPDRESAMPVFALAFGSLSDAGNVWVKIADAPTPVALMASLI